MINPPVNVDNPVTPSVLFAVSVVNAPVLGLDPPIGVEFSDVAVAAPSVERPVTLSVPPIVVFPAGVTLKLVLGAEVPTSKLPS